MQYGIPFDLGMVGFWYNKDLFEQAGINAPPATWEEFLEDVQTLKDAGITPLALGEGDKWPGMFWWAYLALRIGGPDAMLQAGEDGSFDSEPFVQAGAELQRLVEMDPFQDGFMAAVWDGAGGQAATIATEGAAMHLMGQWAPGTQNANSPDGEGLGDKLGWFPFPAVEGGAGAPTDVFGGGNGFAVGKDAPPEAVDFLQYATSLDVANRWGETNSGILPVTIGADGSITDPNLTGVLDARADASYVQLYLDQAYPPELGAVINDAVAELYAGQASAGAGGPDDRGCREGLSGATASIERRAAPYGPPPSSSEGTDVPAGGRGQGRVGAAWRKRTTIVLFLLPARRSCTCCSCSCRSSRASTTAASTGTVWPRSPTSSGSTTTARRSPTRCSSPRSGTSS